jgi:2-polyprenyl-3-methyl-5-hydroxy-6-metoxy-1,4-benzoquinol methylase
MKLKQLAILATADSAALRSLYVALRGAYRLLPKYAVDGEAVDAHYKNGDWSSMRSFADAGRYGVLAEWIRRLAPQGPILDIGSGDGLLLEALARLDLEYLGVDFARETVDAMQQRFGGVKRRFELGEASTYVPSHRYPIILFNDMLYYMEEPVRHVKRLAAFLESDGTIIVASHLADAKIRLLDALLEEFDVVEQSYFITGEHRTFVQLALKPRLSKERTPQAKFHRSSA